MSRGTPSNPDASTRNVNYGCREQARNTPGGQRVRHGSEPFRRAEVADAPSIGRPPAGQGRHAVRGTAQPDHAPGPVPAQGRGPAGDSAATKDWSVNASCDTTPGPHSDVLHSRTFQRGRVTGRCRDSGRRRKATGHPTDQPQIGPAAGMTHLGRRGGTVHGGSASVLAVTSAGANQPANASQGARSSGPPRRPCRSASFDVEAAEGPPRHLRLRSRGRPDPLDRDPVDRATPPTRHGEPVATRAAALVGPST